MSQSAPGAHSGAMIRLPVACVAVLLVFAAACGDGSSSSPTTSTTTTTTTTSSTTTVSTSTTTTTTSPSSTTTTTTTQPAVVCEVDDVVDLLDAAVADARLESGDWSGDPLAPPFAERTTNGDEYARRMGLDCGARLADAAEQRLAIVAWTGPRATFVVQDAAAPSISYAPTAVVVTAVEDLRGEFVRDDQSLWAGTGSAGESVVIGHADYNLGAAAKLFGVAEAPPLFREVAIPAEEHAIAALEAAGMRNVEIAQTPPFESLEGYVQFISVTGQISVVDVAPTDWFDPMQARYYTGDSRIETIGGVAVRVTEPLPEDNLGFTLGAELGWACAGYGWIMQPPFNGSVDEMLASAEAVIATEQCGS